MNKLIPTVRQLPVPAGSISHTSKKVINYGDVQSSASMWWKAVFLMPLWGFLAIPLAGAVFSIGGVFCVQVGYSMVLLTCIAYFAEEILKRRVTVDDNEIRFGYRTFNLRALVAMGLTYQRNRAIPNKLVLNFNDGKKLKLALGRLHADDVDVLLSCIDNKVPHCEIDPVLRTLSRCKKLAKDTALETQSLIEVPYNSRLVFRQLMDVFVNSASRWKRVGPVLTTVIAAPVWLTVTKQLYIAVPALHNWYLDNQIAVHNFLIGKAGDLDTWFGEHTQHLAESTSQYLANPIAATLAWIAFAVCSIYFARYLLRANVIFMDASGLRLCQRSFTGWSLPLEKIAWKDLTLACLGKPPAGGDPGEWQILLYRGNRKTPARIAIGAIAAEHRVKFLNAIQKWAPQAEIKSELAETLQPKQERSYTELWLQSLASPPERKSLEPLEPQQQLQDGRYEVIRRLGVGGQGRAYLCLENAGIHGANSQEVVLKETILPIFVQNSVRQEALERFRQEAVMLEGLHSERIVQLLNYFIEDHRGYLVLEHIDGRNLRQLVADEGALFEDEALTLALEMAEILTYLHEKSVIHRDFTPDNLILGKNRQLKLIDFNVAQSAEAGATGTIVGKHAYVPPEQFRGKPTFQSDIYALGATLFYLVTGKDPEPITESDPKAVNADISEQFALLVADCTKLSCTKRVGSAAQLLERIKQMHGAAADADVRQLPAPP